MEYHEALMVLMSHLGSEVAVSVTRADGKPLAILSGTLTRALDLEHEYGTTREGLVEVGAAIYYFVLDPTEDGFFLERKIFGSAERRGSGLLIHMQPDVDILIERHP